MDAQTLKKKVAEILQKPYARRLIPDETEGYTASIQEFPGCFAEGDTPQEAMDNLDNAAASWLEAALLSGYEVKEPTAYHGYSGKIALRVPRGLHKQLAELAELEDTSINQLIVTAISAYVSGKNTSAAIAGMLHEKIFSAHNDLHQTYISVYSNLLKNERPNVAVSQKTFTSSDDQFTQMAHFQWQ